MLNAKNNKVKSGSLEIKKGGLCKSGFFVFNFIDKLKAIAKMKHGGKEKIRFGGNL